MICMTVVVGRRRKAHTLIELVMAMASATVLMAGLAATVMVTSQAFRPETTAQHARTTAAFTVHDLLADIRLATGFTERSEEALTFTVPDRDGDGRAETLTYAWSGVSGDPLTLSYNLNPPVALIQDVRAFSLAYLTSNVAGVSLPAEQSGSPILLLVNDAKNPTADELSRKAMIESWNFAVVVAGLNDDPTTILEAAARTKAIYLSGELAADKLHVGPQLAALAIGVVNEHPNLVDEVGFAQSTSTSLASQVDVVDNLHYITSQVNIGKVAPFTLPILMHQLAELPSPHLNALAIVAGQPALVTIDPGKLLYDGRTAAGRRVMLPWGGNGVDPLRMNSTGQLLTRRAIEWATGLGDVSPELRKFGYETVFVGSNSAKDLQMSTKAHLPDNGRIRTISAYLGGSIDQVRFALYSDKNGQPDALLVQSDVGNTTTEMQWITLSVPTIELSPGDYWLAFSLKGSAQRYRYISSFVGAGERNRPNPAVTNGFLSSWGPSSNSYNGARSVYATYEVAK